jgi:phosphoglycerate kinase
MEGFDIGPRRASLRDGIAKAKTIVWNGPMGVFEKEALRRGHEAVAEACAGDAKNPTRSRSSAAATRAAAIEQMGLADKVSHVSTGGGASLEFLESGRFSTLDILD